MIVKDEWGEWEERVALNGVKTRVLLNPTQEYKDSHTHETESNPAVDIIVELDAIKREIDAIKRKQEKLEM